FGGSARFRQGFGLRMRPAAFSSNAARDDARICACGHDERAHRWIGKSLAEILPPIRKRGCHKAFVLIRRRPKRLGDARKRAHQPALFARSVSGEISSRTFSKSFGSRKLRYTEAKRT